MVENENFIKFSDAVQNTWLKYLVSFITMSLSYYLMYGAILQIVLPKKAKLVFLIIGILSNWSIVNFVNIPIIQSIYGYITLIIASFIFQHKIKKLFAFVAIGLDFAFSVISLFTRNIGFVFVDNYLLLSILVIDMYLMTGLYFLYSNLIRFKKEK
jgi:hypothetical protein